jgi:hemolysin activation/secretion protein
VSLSVHQVRPFACGLALLCTGAITPLRAAEATSASGPGTTYAVERYEVQGGDSRDAAWVAKALRDATGPHVTLPQIRRALVRLQQAYRDRGWPQAAVTLPRQALTQGVVQVRVTTDGAQANPPLPAWTVPTFEVRHFVVQGNTVLTAEQLDRVLGSAAGEAVSPERLSGILRDLQSAYRAEGYPLARLTIPSQVLHDGTVAVVVQEGGRSTNAPALATRPATNAPPAAVPAFLVRRYDVAGNTLLKPEAIEQLLAPATGTNVTLPQIQKALGDLQLAYRERGWATVSVGLPQQQLADGVVKVQVLEGALVDVQVTGQRYFSTNNVLAALPSLKTNALLNSRVFQRELDVANQNRDRQIYPVLGPGPEPGTSSLTLRVKDRLPLHGRVEVNNQAPPLTPEWRINASAQYNHLWEKEHQLGASYGFSPEAYKQPVPASDYLVNRPLIAYGGAYYRLPFGQPESVEQRLQANPGLGFDEATRQFRLPPPGARPDLLLSLNASSVDTGIQRGPRTLVSQTPLLTITSQDTGRNLTTTESASARYSHPFVLGETRRLNLSAGLDLRTFSLESFNTNNFTIVTVVTNAQGTQVIESQVSSAQPARKNDVAYLPLIAAADFVESDAHGTLSASLSLSYNFLGRDEEFAALAYSRRARSNFGKANLQVQREQKLPRLWTAQFRAGAQAATGPLISTEQFALGGMNSLRGYFEGDEVGDAGWFTGGELRTPQIAFKAPIGEATTPGWIRGLVFMEYGHRFQMDGDSTLFDRRSLWSTGFGLSANLNNHLDLRVTVGWPLRGTGNSGIGEPRANLSVGGQF